MPYEIMFIIVGFMALVAAWLILFKTGIIFGINAWIRENVFSDKRLLYSKRRLALLFFALGIFSVFSGMDEIVQDQRLTQAAAKEIIDKMEDHFQKGRYKMVISNGSEVVKKRPSEIRAWELMAGAWWTLGQKKEAFEALDYITAFDPNYPIQSNPLLAKIKKESTTPHAE